MRKFFLLCLAISLLQACSAPENYQFENNVLRFTSGSGTYEVKAVSDQVFKVSYRDSLANGDKVFAPVLTKATKVSLQKSDDNNISLSTATAEIKIQLNPPKFEFLDKNTGHKLTGNGFDNTDDRSQLNFSLSSEEAIYGTGSRATGMNRRGKVLEIYNQPRYGYQEGTDNLNYAIPHWLSSEKYMVLVDNPAKAQLDIGKSKHDILEYSSEGGNSAFYFINGQTYKELISEYTNLTGRQPMVPLWSMGHLQSRFGYRSQQEAEKILDLALKAGYPVDAIILDIYWFGPELEDGQMGKLDWDDERWPEPKQMIQNFNDLGVKTITVSEPFFTKKSSNFQYLSDNKLLALDKEGNTLTIPDFYFGEGGLLDIFKPEAKDWMWNEYKRQKAYGIAGWWVDLGEPEKHPEEMVHHSGSANELHGAYSHEWSKMLSEGYAREFPEERLFNLARAGFAGTQRYGIIPWSGDVGRSWSGLRAQNPIILSMGLSGLGFMHSDAGGFSMGPQDAELYIRWMQYAVFTAIFRPHGDANAAPSEPVLWDPQVQEIIKPFVALRYQMLPYNYTLAWQNHVTGIPLARPMFVEFESIADTLQDQYMWGESMLVAPVMQPGTKSVSVYLPEGKWYNFWDYSMHHGGNHIDVPVALKNIPVFVKEGSIIPMVEPIGNTTEYNTSNLELNYYYSEQPSDNHIYEDDGTTPLAFEKGQYRLININCQPDESSLTFKTNLEGEGYEGEPATRIGTFRIIGLSNSPTSVVSDAKELPFEWDKSSNILLFKAELIDNQIINILH